MSEMWFCPIHGVLAAEDVRRHISGAWGTHGYCSAPVEPRPRFASSARTFVPQKQPATGKIPATLNGPAALTRPGPGPGK